MTHQVRSPAYKLAEDVGLAVMRMARARSVTPAILLDASRTLTDAVTKGQQDGTMTPKEAKFLLAEAKKLQTQAKKL